MSTNGSPAVATLENLLQTPPPAVVVCGPTAAGKSVLARKLAEIVDLDHLPGGEHVRGTTDEVRRSDLTLLRQLADRDRPVVVESSALPRLLPVDNTALIVQLTASTMVRARRQQHRSANSSYLEASHLVELNDAITCTQLRSTWGVDISDARATRWRADLVLGCPHVLECPNEQVCLEIVTGLLTAAYRVYENYLAVTPALDSREAATTFAQLSRRYPAHIRRCRPALIAPTNEFRVTTWRHRVAGELDQRTGL